MRNKRGGGCFLLPAPTVTNSFYFRKWSTLYCPDFPLAPSASGRPKHSFGDKGSAKNRISKENGKKMFYSSRRNREAPYQERLALSDSYNMNECKMVRESVEETLIC